MRIACIRLLVALLILPGCLTDPAGKTTQEDDAFSFAFLTDIHLQPERGAAIAFQWAIREVNKRGPDFVLTGGDMVMDVLNQSYGRADSLFRMYEDLSEKFRMPVYNTLGNHEVYGWQRVEEGIEQHPEFGKGMYEQRLGPRYYSFDHKGWHFIILDAVYLEERGVYSGKIDEEQISWISSELDKLDQWTPIAISAHFPFISSAFQLTMGPEAKIPDGLLIENSRQVLALFSDYNLRLVLQGHLHFLEGIHVQDQVHFITGGAVCGKWWNNGPESKPEEGFVMVHIKGEELSWEYVDYGWNPSKEL
jgi:3',5'-cyclic AMP phosphodiesterase CpdA